MITVSDTLGIHYDHHNYNQQTRPRTVDRNHIPPHQRLACRTAHTSEVCPLCPESCLKHSNPGQDPNRSEAACIVARCQESAFPARNHSYTLCNPKQRRSIWTLCSLGKRADFDSGKPLPHRTENLVGRCNMMFAPKIDSTRPHVKPTSHI